jgi:hypothetical protein
MQSVSVMIPSAEIFLRGIDISSQAFMAQTKVETIANPAPDHGKSPCSLRFGWGKPDISNSGNDRLR